MKFVKLVKKSVKTKKVQHLFGVQNIERNKLKKFNKYLKMQYIINKLKCFKIKFKGRFKMFKSMIVLVLSVIIFVIPFNVFADDIPTLIQYTTTEEKLVSKDATIFILAVFLFVFTIFTINFYTDSYIESL